MYAFFQAAIIMFFECQEEIAFVRLVIGRMLIDEILLLPRDCSVNHHLMFVFDNNLASLIPKLDHDRGCSDDLCSALNEDISKALKDDPNFRRDQVQASVSSRALSHKRSLIRHCIGNVATTRPFRCHSVSTLHFRRLDSPLVRSAEEVARSELNFEIMPAAASRKQNKQVRKSALRRLRG